MSKASKEEIVEMKLKQAFKLIKEERYGAARHILREFPNHPKAQAMVSHIEGKVEKRRGFSAITPRTVILSGVVISLFLMCFASCGLLVYYASRYSLDEMMVLGAGAFGDGDAAILGPAISYCHISQDWKVDVCQEWPAVVYVQYPAAMETCFGPYRARVFFELEEVLAIRRCLQSFGVPVTY